MRIDEFLGLNENSNGDTGLKAGEACKMLNWRVTADGKLKLRPGTKKICNLGSTPVRGIFRGKIGENNVCVAACGGKLWKIDEQSGSKTQIGSLTDAQTNFFGFSGKLYIQNGHEYMSWSGLASSSAGEVEGYIPIVAAASPPSGGGTPLESVNKLTGKKRMRFSPDGQTKSFQLAETDIESVDTVRSLSSVTLSAYTVNTSAGTVTFSTAPPAGTSSLEIGWTKGTGDRSKIEAMRFAESFNGATVTRIFLGGDGTNKMVYSGIGEDLQPNAEYFPDLNVLDIDSANTAVTGIVKHYDKLLSFKSDGCYSTAYGSVSLSDGKTAEAFYTVPVHRSLGNDALGQIQIIDNCPVTLCRSALWRWTGSVVSDDERNAKRISQRVEKTLSEFESALCVSCDDQQNGEYYLFCGNKALVYNYLRDCFYLYEGINVTAACSKGKNILLGTAEGDLLLLSNELRSDVGNEIKAIWESGSMDFGSRENRKSVGDVFISLRPESGSRCSVSVYTQSGQVGVTKLAASSYLSFEHIDFSHFGFGTSRRAQVRRLRIRAKKFVYWKLRLESNSASASATVLGISIQPRAVTKLR